MAEGCICCHGLVAGELRFLVQEEPLLRILGEVKSG